MCIISFEVHEIILEKRGKEEAKNKPTRVQTLKADEESAK